MHKKIITVYISVHYDNHSIIIVKDNFLGFFLLVCFLLGTKYVTYANGCRAFFRKQILFS